MPPFLQKIVSLGKKIFIIIFVYIIAISLFVYFINKDKPKPPQVDYVKKNRQDIYQVLNDPKYQKTPTGKLKLYLFQSMACGALGEGCTDNPDDGDKNYRHSLIGYTANIISMPFTKPPASSVYWVYSTLQNAGFIQNAYAAEGLGFASLKPFINIWKIFRDLAYMLLVLILIGIGFMVMFRMKINPQTVISIENSLPKIVITLFLIAFSYAIAGFLIDLMYVTIAFSISLLSNNGTYYNISEMQGKYLGGNMGGVWESMFAVKLKGPTIFGINLDNVNMAALGPFGIVLYFLGFGGSSSPIFGGFQTLFYIGDAIMQIMPAEINASIRIIVAAFGLLQIVMLSMDAAAKTGTFKIFNNLNLFGNSVGMIPEGILRNLATVFFIAIIIPGLLIHGGGFIIGIIILFTMIFLFIRILVMLVKAYLNILLLVVFSPLIIMFEAIPGKNAFGYWIKNLFGEIITFPIIVVIFLLGKIIVSSLPNMGGSIAAPMLGGIDPNAFFVILGMGLIFLIPDLVKMCKGLIGIKEGLPISIGPGAFFAGAGAGVGSGIGLLGQFSTINLGLGAMKGFGLFGKGKPDALAQALEKINTSLGQRGGGTGQPPQAPP